MGGTTQSPLEVMTGIKPKTQILRLLSPLVYSSKAKTLEHALAIRVIKVKSFRDAFNALHKIVDLFVRKNRDQAIINCNQFTNIFTPSFAMRDFFLTRHATDRVHKLFLSGTIPVASLPCAVRFRTVSHRSQAQKQNLSSVMNFRNTTTAPKNSPCPMKCFCLQTEPSYAARLLSKLWTLMKLLTISFFKLSGKACLVSATLQGSLRTSCTLM